MSNGADLRKKVNMMFDILEAKTEIDFEAEYAGKLQNFKILEQF